jgi:hypothetical protein
MEEMNEQGGSIKMINDRFMRINQEVSVTPLFDSMMKEEKKSEQETVERTLMNSSISELNREILFGKQQGIERWMMERRMK